MTDLQKASIWKRAFAFILDAILFCILAVGAAYLVSAVSGYDGYYEKYGESYAAYEKEYGITFDITEAEYNALGDTERQNYDAAYEAFTADSEVLRLYSMMVNLTLVIATSGILVSVMVIDFVIPLCLGNGQTVGKKIFGICLMRTDWVKVSTLQLFIRALLGRYAIETMIPALIIIMIYFNSIGLVGTVVLIGLAVLQVGVMCVTRTDSAIHDLLAGTVVVDMSSQMIFDNADAMLEYRKRIAAEDAARREYR